MPLEYEVLEGGTLVAARATGHFDAEDCLGYEAQIAADPRVQVGYRELYDVTRVISFEFSEADMLAIAQASSSSPKDTPERRVAIVVDDREGARLARLYRSFAEEQEFVKVFGEEERALAWLLAADP